jgi:Zn finger protein HypA/HybF involved in hydrogenase expression
LTGSNRVPTYDLHRWSDWSNEEGVVGSLEMPIIVFVYQCSNGACRNIQKSAGMKRSQITCPKCRSTMNFVGIEKKNENTK